MVSKPQGLTDALDEDEVDAALVPPAAHPSGPRLTVVHAMAYRFPPGWQFGPEVVPYSIVRLVLGGRAVVSLDRAERTIEGGDVVFVPEGTMLSSHSSEGLSFISVRFTSSLAVAGHDLIASGFAMPLVSRVADPAAMRWHFDALVEQWRHPTPARAFLGVGHLHLILGTLLADTLDDVAAPIAPTHRVAPRVPDARMEQAIELLSAASRSRVDVVGIARHIHMSESTLRRRFQLYTGKSVSDYHKELRMVRAAEALLLTDAPIATVARDTGFDDPSYFTRVFRSVFGASPAKYRRAARNE